jgi:ubiquinone biosynthesis monooxygenase Coq6
VLVGDAAHTVHPLSGQGLNMGLADAKALTKCIEEAVLNGGDIGSSFPILTQLKLKVGKLHKKKIGSYTSLIPYSRARYFENHKLLSATDKLHKLYSTTLPPVVWARSVGLEVVNEWSALKGALMGEAGAEGDSESGGGSYWEMASKGVGSVVGGVDFVKGVVGALVGSSGKRSV